MTMAAEAHTGKQNWPSLPADIQPFLPEDITHNVPPPSYEEAMGEYRTSVSSLGSDIPPLAYIDIMPKCVSPGNLAGKIAPKFDNFSGIIDGANAWLAAHPGLMVWKCETIERKLEKLPRDTGFSYSFDTMVRLDSIFGFQVFVRGIRMWLTMKQGSEPPQKLGLVNIIPQTKQIIFPTRYRHGYVTIAGGPHVTAGVPNVTNNAMMMVQGYETFVGLDETIEWINESLEEDPLPGTILTIETNSVKAFEGFQRDLDPEAASWSENKMRFKRRTQLIRIFYLEGPPAHEEIGLHQVIPEVTQLPDVLKPPKFENMSTVLETLARWTTQNQGVRIVNIQQHDSQLTYFGDRFKIHSNSTDDGDAFGDRSMVQTIRVFYVQSTKPRHAPSDISSRLFVPARLGAKVFESMTETMGRIDAWMRLTGLPVYNVETVELLLQEARSLGVDLEKVDYKIAKMAGNYWVTAIRIYFPQRYQEPDPSLLPPVHYPTKQSSSCTII